MSLPKRLLALPPIYAAFGYSTRTSILSGLQRAYCGWKDNPYRMASQLITSFVIGQGIFWRWGYDQLGIAMDTKKQFGLGQKVALKTNEMLPGTPAVSWAIKATEIACDAGKMPIEGNAYQRHGIVSDVVAAGVTQPLWSYIETCEKLFGIFVNPNKVHTRDQRLVSLGCIYGSLFRFGLGLAVIRFGARINRILTNPIEYLLRRAGSSLNS